MPLHQDALGPFDRGPAAERPLEVVVLREAAQDDVDGALPVLRLGVGDVREDAALRRLLDEFRVGGVDEHDHGAGRLLHDLLDQRQGVIRARAQPHQGDVGPLPRCHRSDVFDLDLARDHLVPERGNDGCDKG